MLKMQPSWFLMVIFFLISDGCWIYQVPFQNLLRGSFFFSSWPISTLSYDSVLHVMIWISAGYGSFTLNKLCFGRYYLESWLVSFSQGGASTCQLEVDKLPVSILAGVSPPPRFTLTMFGGCLFQKQDHLSISALLGKWLQPGCRAGGEDLCKPSCLFQRALTSTVLLPTPLTPPGSLVPPTPELWEDSTLLLVMPPSPCSHWSFSVLFQNQHPLPVSLPSSTSEPLFIACHQLFAHSLDILTLYSLSSWSI